MAADGPGLVHRDGTVTLICGLHTYQIDLIRGSPGPISYSPLAFAPAVVILARWTHICNRAYDCRGTLVLHQALKL